ncbi:hypothetical protein STSO111631_00485 [Stackebrandtia soli]
MIRGNSEHSPRIDEELADESRVLRPGEASRAGQWREPELPVDDEPGGPMDVEPRTGGTPKGMTESDVDGRYEMARYLPTGLFPATDVQIQSAADMANAPRPVTMELEKLPEGTYDSVTDVWSTLGHGVESGR